MGINLMCGVQEGKSFVNVVEGKRWISQRVSNGKMEETHDEIAAWNTVLFLGQLIVIWAVRKRFPSLCGDQNFINFHVTQLTPSKNKWITCWRKVCSCWFDNILWNVCLTRFYSFKKLIIWQILFFFLQMFLTVSINHNKSKLKFNTKYSVK